MTGLVPGGPGLVLDDLESLERSGRIGRAAYRRLREMILRSPHIVSRR